MTTPSPILHQYELIASITSRMLELAHDQQWDNVVQLGEQYIQAVEALRRMAPLNLHERQARRVLLDQILSDDAHIRSLAAPELARLGALLGTARKQRHVLQAYGTPAP